MTAQVAQVALFFLGLSLAGLGLFFIPDAYDEKWQDSIQVQRRKKLSYIFFGVGFLFTAPGLFTLWTFALFG